MSRELEKIIEKKTDNLLEYTKNTKIKSWFNEKCKAVILVRDQARNMEQVENKNENKRIRAG